MALYKPSAVIETISGTIGGVNFVSGGRTPVLRAPRRPIAIRLSPNQATAQTWPRLIATSWQAQTAAVRAAWATFGATLRWRDRLGTPRTPTGRQTFFWRQTQNLQAGFGLLPTTIPTPANDAYWLGFQLSATAVESVSVDLLYSGIVRPWVVAYAQTFFGPTPQYIDGLAGTPNPPFPNKWRFIKAHSDPAVSNFNLYPEAAKIIGRLANNQRIAVLCRYSSKLEYSAKTYTAIDTL